MPSSLIKSPIGARPRDPASDLTATMRFLSTAWLLGWDDVEARYRRTLLGPMWIVASNAIWVGTLTYLTSALFGQDVMTNLLYIATGLVCFSYITSSMVESTTVFLRAKSWISSTQFPLAIHAFRALFGWLITFAHQLVIIVLAFVIAGYLPSATALLAIIGLLIVNVMMFGLALLFGTLGARFRDLTHVLASMTTLFFIVTPIFWFKALLPPGHPILAFNPMYYFMEILRAPLLGEVPPLEIWLVAGSIAIGTLGLGLITFYRSFKSIMLWL